MNFGAITIRIDEKTEGAPPGIRATIITTKNGRTIDTKTLASMFAVGGYAGLSIAKEQPIAGLFLIHKDGDYSERTMIVSGDGRIVELHGGTLFRDKTRLFALTDSEADDSPRVDVLDIATGAPVNGARPSREEVMAMTRVTLEWVRVRE